MHEEKFPLRLAQLRNQKGVSARDMSLTLGQNPGYINNIESGKALPSMGNFFYICEYLNVSPSEFFDLDTKNPGKLSALMEDIKQFDDKQLEAVNTLVQALKQKNG